MANQSDRGATAVEYGLFLAAIAAVFMLIAFAIGVKTAQGLQLALSLWP